MNDERWSAPSRSREKATDKMVPSIASSPSAAGQLFQLFARARHARFDSCTQCTAREFQSENQSQEETRVPAAKENPKKRLRESDRQGCEPRYFFLLSLFSPSPSLSSLILSYRHEGKKNLRQERKKKKRSEKRNGVADGGDFFFIQVVVARRRILLTGAFFALSPPPRVPPSGEREEGRWLFFEGQGKFRL